MFKWHQRWGEKFLTNSGFDLLDQVPVLAEKIFGVFSPLGYILVSVRIVRAPFADDLHIRGNIEQVANSGDSFIIHDIKFCGAERWGNFVLDDAYACAIADNFRPDFDVLDTAHIQSDGCIEFERLSASRSFWVAVGNSNLLA